MSEEVQVEQAKAADTEANAEALGQEATVSSSDEGADVEAKADNGIPKSSYDRVLEESKSHKQRAQQAERELAKIREAEAKRQGKYKELAEQKDAELNSLREKWVKAQVNTALAGAASQYGYAGSSVDTLLKLGDHDLLAFDEDTGRVEGIEVYMEDLKKREPSLFRVAQANISEKVPTAQAPQPTRKAPANLQDALAEKKAALMKSFGG